MVRQWHGARCWKALCTRLRKCYQILHNSSSARGDINPLPICFNYHSLWLYNYSCSGLRLLTTLSSCLLYFIWELYFYKTLPTALVMLSYYLTIASVYIHVYIHVFNICLLSFQGHCRPRKIPDHHQAVLQKSTGSWLKSPPLTLPLQGVFHIIK